MNRRKLFRAAIITTASIMLLVPIASFLVLRSRSFNLFLLRKIAQQAEQSTGARIDIQKLNLHWLPFTADFYGVVVHGQERPGAAPLLQAEHLRVSLGLRALLKKQVDLYAVTLDRPLLNLRVDTHGKSNFPKAPATTPSGNETVVIRHASLRDGIVNYNDAQIPLSAELDDFHAEARFDAAANKYQGTLGYRQGCVIANALNPVEHSAQIDFSANGNGVILDPVIVSAGKTHLTAHLQVADLANPAVTGNYKIFLVSGDIAHLLKNSQLPGGNINLTGSLDYHSSATGPFLKTIQASGRFDSPSLSVHTSQMSAPLQSIHGTFRLQDGNLKVDTFDADVLEGHVTAQAAMLHLDQDPAFSVNAKLRGLSLERLGDSLPANARQKTQLLGRLSLTAQARWAGDISSLRARSHMEITGPSTLPSNGNRIPLNGVIDVDYDGGNQMASFGQSYVRIANTELALNGVLSRQSNLHVDVNAKDLHELTALASMFASSAAINPSDSHPTYDLHGSAHFAGQVSGPPSTPRIQGQLSGANLEAQGSKWRIMRVNVDAAANEIRLQQGYLQSASQGDIRFNGSTELRNWLFTPQSPMALQAKVNRLSVADLERLTKLEYPVTGELTGDIQLSGSELRPAGHGSLQISKASAWNEPVRSLNLDFEGDKDSIRTNAKLQIPAGTAAGRLTYNPGTEKYDVSLTTHGLKLDQLQNVQQHASSVAGDLNLEISGQGTVKDPQLSATLQMPQLMVSGQAFSGIHAQMDLAHERANVILDSVVEQGYVHAKGSVDLSGQFPSDVSIDVRALPIGPLLAKHSATTGAAQDLQGFTEIHASLKGPLKNPSLLQGLLEIPRLNLAYKGVQVANDGPIRIRYREGVATVEQARLKGTGTDLSLQGVVPIQSTLPLNVSAKGGIDVQLLQLLSPDVHATGKVNVDLRAAGAISEPKTEGSIKIVDTALSMEDAPLSVSAMNGQLSIDGNRLQIDKLEGTAGGGTISANGSATYGKEINFAVDLHAKSVRIRPTGIRTTLDGDLQLNGTPLKSQLSGRVLVDRLSFQEGFDLATFMSELADDSTVSAPSPVASNMNLSIAVSSAQNLDLASSQVSIAGSANLNVTGNAANPVILGRIGLTSGELFFQGKRFEIQNGTIAFVNPAKTEPVLNLYVKTVVEQYNITINFSGPLDRMKTNYTSDPSLPPLDIINLLAFGQTTAEKASNASTPASLGAESALAQGVAGQVAKGVQNLTGISQLTIDPTAGNNQNPGAQVAIQQRVTGSILLTFSTDVTSTQRQTVQLQYEPKKHVKISVVRDEYGGYGVDVRLHKVF